MTNWAGKKVLIAGGLGFIGSNLARRLVDLRAEVILVDSLIPQHGGDLRNIAGIENRVQFHKLDVREEAKIIPLLDRQDYLFNLVGQTCHLDSMHDPFTDLEINCSSQLSLLETVRKYHPAVKIIFASTRQIYGVPDYLPVDEAHPLHPVDTNGIHKMAGEWYHRLYQKIYGLRACILRLTNTYGPRMRTKDARQTFLGWWIHQILAGEKIKIFGTGKQLRDFTFVEDAVEALLMAASDEKADGQIFNLGGEGRVSLEELAELLVEIHGSGSYQIVPFPKDLKAIDIGDYYANYRFIQDRLGWRPKTGLKEGLKRTLDYCRESSQAKPAT